MACCACSHAFLNLSIALSGFPFAKSSAAFTSSFSDLVISLSIFFSPANVLAVSNALFVRAKSISTSKQETSTVEVQQQIKITDENFDLSSLEPLAADKIGKTYLTKILKEYYAKNISKEDFVHLKSFEDLECSVTFEDTPNGEEINISCNIKQK